MAETLKIGVVELRDPGVLWEEGWVLLDLSAPPPS
jgi:hypothetical protein